MIDNVSIIYVLYAIKMLLSMEMFFRCMEVWYSNDHPLKPKGSVGGLTLKEEDCSDSLDNSSRECTMYILSMHNDRLTSKVNCHSK